MMLSIDRHLRVPGGGLVEVEVEAGDDGRDGHVEFCVRKAVDGVVEC